MDGRQDQVQVRPATQAGRFYPADADELRAQVTGWLDAAGEPGGKARPIAIVAPHAGYIFSGRVAGAAFAAVRGGDFTHALILGPSHYADFTGAALPSVAGFATPLGELTVDRPAVRALAHEDCFAINDHAHGEPEHALEVELPFIQVALPRVTQILPVLIGRSDPRCIRMVSKSLGHVIGQRQAAGERWLIVVSSDTYHGHDGEACSANNRKIEELVINTDAQLWLEAAIRREVMACGWAPIAVALELVREGEPMHGEVWVQSDSRVESGRREGYVVGYMAAGWSRMATKRSS